MNNTIRRLQLKIDKDDRKISEDDRKIKEEMIEIAKLSAQNNDLVNKVVDTQKSLNRLLNNHFIKPQLTVYSFVKKYLIKKS